MHDIYNFVKHYKNEYYKKMLYILPYCDVFHILDTVSTFLNTTREEMGTSSPDTKNPIIDKYPWVLVFITFSSLKL